MQVSAVSRDNPWGIWTYVQDRTGKPDVCSVQSAGIIYSTTRYFPMQSCRCIFCDREFAVPDVCRCPFCYKDLKNATEEFCRKHIRNCSGRESSYKYTGRKRGRPSRDELWAMHGIAIENDK